MGQCNLKHGKNLVELARRTYPNIATIGAKEQFLFFGIEL